MKESLFKLGICVLIGAVLWYIPLPDNLPDNGWQVFSVFVAVILSLILRPFPMGQMVLLGLVVLVVTGTLNEKEALAGYGNTTVWLVVAAFLIAGGMINTGLGRRIALKMVHGLGKSSLGLGYALCGAELILGPIVPSNTARGGGVVAPVMNSLAGTLDSRPDHQPERIGRFLALVGAHANLVTAAMFLTGMAANPLVAKAASDVFDVEFGWGMWALGGIVPGLLTLALLPVVIHKLETPTLTDTRPAQEHAARELEAMGPWSQHEKMMAFVFVVLLLLWSTNSLHGLHTTIVAWIGVTLLALSGTQKWDDFVSNKNAWDTLIWVGGLLTMANALRDHGFVGWFADTVGGRLAGLPGIALVLVLALVYFYSMYFFSMLTAHIAAMVAAFFAIALGAGAPPLLTVAVLAYFSNLCASITNYSTGPVVIYFGLGYVSAPQWFRIGFVISLFHIAIWFSAGMLWWKILGWW